MRATGIGGSDAAAILGLSGYGSPYTVAMEKVAGLKEMRTDEEQERLDWGKALEPLLISAFERKTGMPVDQGAAWVRHPKAPFLFANVDGLIPDADGLGRPYAGQWTPIVPAELSDLGPGIFEGKCAGQDDGWGTTADPRVPTSYWAQAQHYMAVIDRRWTGFGALINGNRLEVRFVLRDDAWIEQVWWPKLTGFWADIQAGRLPDPLNPDTDGPVLRARFPDGASGARNLTDAETRIVYAWQAAHEEAARAKRQSEALGLSVRAMMADYSVGRLTTGEQITYKLTASGSRTLRQPHKAR
jgi:putative phage-type endonuclease